MKNYTSDWSNRLNSLLFGENLEDVETADQKPIRIKYKANAYDKQDHELQSKHHAPSSMKTSNISQRMSYKIPDNIQDILAQETVASAFVDTRNYVASANSMTQYVDDIGNENLIDEENYDPEQATSGTDFTRHRGTGPYGRVSHLPNQRQLYNNRRRIGAGIGTSGNRFLDYGENSYGSGIGTGTGFGHYGVNRVGYVGTPHNNEVPHIENYGFNQRMGLVSSGVDVPDCPDEYGINSYLLIAVALGTLVGFLNLYDRVVVGRKHKQQSLGMLHLIMTGWTSVAFHFSLIALSHTFVYYCHYYSSRCKDLSV